MSLFVKKIKGETLLLSCYHRGLMICFRPILNSLYSCLRSILLCHSAINISYTHTLGGISLIGKHQIKQIHLNAYWGQIDSQRGDSGSMFLLASQTHLVVLWAKVCVQGVLACSTSCLLNQSILTLERWWRGS